MSLLTGTKITGLSVVTSVATSRKILLSDTSLNETITYENFLIQLGADLGSFNLLDTKGDILTHDGVSAIKLGVGADDYYLTGASGALVWKELPDTLIDPMTNNGDIIVRINNAPANLSAGAENSVLTIINSIPEWSTASSYTDPLEVNGQMLVRSGGATVPLGVGDDGQVLKLVTGAPTWSDSVEYEEKLLSQGDILTRNASETIALNVGSVGQVLSTTDGVNVSWETLAGYSDPLSAEGQMLLYTGGASSPLLPGTNGHVLTVVEGTPSWQELDAGLTDVTESLGDLIVRGAGGLERLAADIANNGKILTVDSGLPTWQTDNNIKNNILTTEGDIMFFDDLGAVSRLARGDTGQILVAGSSTISWENNSALADPTTAAGELIYSTGVTGGDLDPIPIGAEGQTLTTISGAPTWSDNYSLGVLATRGAIVYQGDLLPTSLPISANSGYVLTSNGTDPVWSAPVGDSNAVLNAGNTGAYGEIKVKVIEINAWDMESLSPNTIAHGITDGIARIRSISISIVNNAENIVTPLDYNLITGENSGSYTWNDSTISMNRKSPGYFDYFDYGANGSFNRGWVTITYEEIVVPT